MNKKRVFHGLNKWTTNQANFDNFTYCKRSRFLYIKAKDLLTAEQAQK